MATAPSPNDLTRQQLDELDALLQRMLAIPLNPAEPPAPPPPTAVPAPPRLEAKPAPASNWRVDSPPPANFPTPHMIPAEPPPAMPMVEAPPAIPMVGPRPPLRPEPERYVPPEPVARTLPLPSAAPLDPPLPEPEPVPLAEESVTLPFETSSIPIREPLEPPVPKREAEPPPFSFPFHSPPVSLEPPAAPVPNSLPSRPYRRRPVRKLFWPLVALNYVVDGCLNLTGFPGRLITCGPVKTLLGLAGIGLIAYTLAHLGQQKGWIHLSSRSLGRDETIAGNGCTRIAE